MQLYRVVYIRAKQSQDFPDIYAECVLQQSMDTALNVLAWSV